MIIKIKKEKEERQTSIKLDKGCSEALRCIESRIISESNAIGINSANLISKSFLISELINLSLMSKEPIVEVESKKLSPFQILNEESEKIKKEVNKLFHQEKILQELFNSISHISNFKIRCNNDYDSIYDDIYNELEIDNANYDEEKLMNIADEKAKEISYNISYNIDRFNKIFESSRKDIFLDSLKKKQITFEGKTISQLAIYALTNGGNSCINDLNFDLENEIKDYFLTETVLKEFELVRITDSFTYFEIQTKLNKIIESFIDYIDNSIINPQNKEQVKEINEINNKFFDLINSLPEEEYNIIIEDDYL